MNKKGQLQILGVMMVVFATITGFVLATPLKELTEEARNSDNLDCETEGQSNGVYATCLIVDLFLPFFIGTLVLGGISLFAIGRRKGG